MRGILLVLTAGFVVATISAGCAGAGARGSGDRNRLTSEELAAVDVSTLYEVVQRLRPRWLEVRSPRGLGTETGIAVFLDRTYIGNPEELRGLGIDVAEWIEYRTGSQVAAELTVPGGQHVEGAIIVHTGARSQR
jgi:hypothetical protein